jgi:hydrogenase maturation protease
MNIKIVGCGNLLRGDDGIGIWTLKELEKFPLPQGVELVDMGTRGIDILFRLEGAEKVIIIDAVMSGKPPGTIYRMGREDLGDSKLNFLSLHDFNWQHGLALAEKTLGKNFPKEAVVVGVEIKNTKMRIVLSRPVRNSLPDVVNLIQKEIRKEASPQDMGKRN